MLTEVLNYHEIIFGLCALVFSIGGFFAIQKKLPEMLNKSIDKIEIKIDKIQDKMSESDKTIQNMQVSQARNDEKVNSVQVSQLEMKQDISEIFRILNTSFKGK